MGKLAFYSSLDEKAPYFNQNDAGNYRIDSAWQFNQWYDNMKQLVGGQGPFANFFRGMTDARYKLYNSSQRFWIRNNLREVESLSAPLSYIDMIQNMVNKAKEVKLLQQVFQYYELENEQQDFPLLSILQHYSAPTPLMDWTYDLDVALYFAIDGMRQSEKAGVIEDYVTIYRMNKAEHATYMMDNLNFISGNVFPSLSGLAGFLGGQRVVYISDFEIQGQSDPQNRKIKPLTTYYNLNILAQKGIFIFNPHEDLPLEGFAALHAPVAAGAGMGGAPVGAGAGVGAAAADNRIYCYHINKDLAEFIRYRIGKESINEGFIYPELKSYARNILTDYLKFVIG